MPLLTAFSFLILLSSQFIFAITHADTCRLLLAAIQEGKPMTYLETLVPNLGQKLQVANSVSQAHWYESTPPSDFMSQYAAPETILNTLGIVAQTTSGQMHVSAGTMHSYGYALIPIQTKYGPKGERWNTDRLDERLGLPAHTFSPSPRAGEFLSNLTQALMEVLPGYPRRELPHADPAISTAINGNPPNYQGYISETIQWQAGEQRQTGVVRTHLVSLRDLPNFKSDNSHLLIYEMEIAGSRRFITTYPITPKKAEQLRSTSASMGTAFSPSNNLYIDPSWIVTSYNRSMFTHVP